MLNIAKRQILPAAMSYSGELGNTVQAVASTGIPADTQKAALEIVCGLIKSLNEAVVALEKEVCGADKVEGCSAEAQFCRDNMIPAMKSVRKVADELEMVVDADMWPLPTYAEMLFLK